MRTYILVQAMTDVRYWLAAARLRTLPLAVSTIGMGHTLAYIDGYHDLRITILSILTAVFLQVLSNFSNDYGDSIHGADSAERQGPMRMVQSGVISLSQMKQAMYIMALMSLCTGSLLIWVAIDGWMMKVLFFVLGLLAIWAAVNYTAGDKPYGYTGKGDISVFIFFGLITVIGSYYLQTGSINWMILLPAIACGTLSTGVLNVNNIRDIESDYKAGKMSIPVKIGRSAAVQYHGFLLVAAVMALVTYGILVPYGWSLRWLFIPVSSLLLVNFIAVRKHHSADLLDPYLKQLALSSTALIASFCLCLIMFS